MFRKTISYSFLHLLACPYSAFLRYEAALKGPTTQWIAQGNAVHYGLEKGHTEDGFSFELAVKEYKTELARIVDEDHVLIAWPALKKLEGEGVLMLGGYNEQVASGIISPKPMVLEKEFKLPFEDIEVVGRIDKIEYEDGYIVTDFKTGKAAPNDFDLRHNLQLTTYAWACLQLFGELPKKVIWHHMRNGKLLESVRTMDDIGDLQSMLHNAISMSKQGIKHRIFHDKVCGQCDYAGSTCEDRELEKEVLQKQSIGQKMEPRIVIKARAW